MRAELLERDAVTAAGEPIHLALELAIEEGWHVYWTNPGDSGTAPTLELELPGGWTQGPFEWPVPKRHEQGDLVTFVHEGTLVLPFTVTPPEDFTAGTIEATGTARWLACEEICLAEDQAVAATPTVGKAREPGPDAERLDAAREAAIRRGENASALVDWHERSQLLLRVEWVDEEALLGAPFVPTAWEIVFWPATPGLLDLTERSVPLRRTEGLPWSPAEHRVEFLLPAASRTQRDGLPEGARGAVELRPKEDGLDPVAVWVDLPPLDPAP